MLSYGRYSVMLRTVPDGVLVSVYDRDGLVCEVVDHDAQPAVLAAVLAALAAAQTGEPGVGDGEPMSPIGG